MDTFSKWLITLGVVGVSGIGTILLTDYNREPKQPYMADLDKDGEKDIVVEMWSLYHGRTVFLAREEDGKTVYKPFRQELERMKQELEKKRQKRPDIWKAREMKKSMHSKAQLRPV